MDSIEPSHIKPKYSIEGIISKPLPLSAREVTPIITGSSVATLGIPKAIQDTLNEIEEPLSNIQSTFQFADNITPELAPSLKSCSEKMVETIALKLQAGDNLFNLEESVFSMIDTALAESLNYMDTPLDLMLIPLTGIDSDTIAAHLTNVQLGFNAANILTRGALLLYQNILMGSAKKKIEQLKASDLPNDQKKAKILELWLSKQQSFAFEFSTSNVLYLLNYIPRNAWEIVNQIKVQGAIPEVGYLGYTALISLISDCYTVVKAEKESAFHKKWVRRYDQKPIQHLLQKRKDAFHQRVEHQRESFFTWFDSLIENHDLEVIQNALKNKGVHLSDSIKSKNEIRKKREECLIEHVKHRETIKASLLNPLRNFAKQKHEQERKFLNYNRVTSKVNLTLNFIISAATITLKVLAIVGIMTVSAIALPLLITSGVGIALGLILIAVGIIYLYRKKPNLFKTYLQGVQIKLAFSVLPKYFYEFRLNKGKIDRISQQITVSTTSAQFEQLKIKLAQKDLSEKERKILEKKKDVLYKTLIRLQEEKAELMIKIKHLNKKFSYWEKKTNALENRIKEAKWKDFIRKTGLTDSLVDTAAQAIATDANEWDTEMLTILKEELNIDLEAIQNEKFNKEEILQALKDFFSFDEKQLLAFIKTQPQRFST